MDNKAEEKKEYRECESVDKVTFTCVVGEVFLNQKERSAYYKAFKKMETDLASLNMGRGGVKDLSKTSGFVFEELHAADKNIQSLKGKEGIIYEVLNDNGVADIKSMDIESEKILSYQQAKRGYERNPYQINVDKYQGQEIVIDKGNMKLKQYLEKKGSQVEESNISKKRSDIITQVMKQESNLWEKIGKEKNAPITAKLVAAQKQIELANQVGLQAARAAFVLEAGISFGKNMYEFIEGNKDLREVVIDSSKDAIVAGAKSYVSSFVVTPALQIVASSGPAGMAIACVGNSVMVSLASVGLPILLAGMVIGTGCQIIGAIKGKQAMYNREIVRLGYELELVLRSLQDSYRMLDKGLKEYCNFLDENIENGFSKIHEAIEKNDFESFSEGLEIIAQLYDSSVRFKTQEEFDEFFYKDYVLSM